MELSLKNYVFLITYTIITLCLVLNFSYILGLLNKIILLLMPFIYGFIIAYIINWPYEFLKRYVSKYIFNKKIVKFVSISLSYLLLFSIFLFVFVNIIPHIYINLVQFLDNLSEYTESFFIWSKNIENKFKLNLIPNDYINSMIKNLPNLVEKYIQAFLPNVFYFTKSFAIGIYNWIIGLIVSFYLIGSKEKLIYQLKILMYTYIPRKFCIKISKIINLTHATFGKFLIGKAIDSLIVGILCFLGASILQTPYTLLISVIIGITNIIPFFGPFIGAVPCIIILLIVNPMKAMWFTVFILILQQIDGNIIGPKILGNTVGISGLWIMFSVIIGGGLFGITGMIIGVPVFAVLYTIISECVYSYYSFENLNK